MKRKRGKRKISARSGAAGPYAASDVSEGRKREKQRKRCGGGKQRQS